jgi:hypothetical protein
MYSMRHVKGAAMNLKAEGLDAVWPRTHDPSFKDKYTYDHIAVKLISQHAWVRVPHWIPGVETHPQEGIVWEQKRI